MALINMTRLNAQAPSQVGAFLSRRRLYVGHFYRGGFTSRFLVGRRQHRAWLLSEQAARLRQRLNMDAKAARAAEGHAKRHKHPQSHGKWWERILVPRWLVMLTEHAAGWAFVVEKFVMPLHGAEFLAAVVVCVPIGLFLMAGDS